MKTYLILTLSILLIVGCGAPVTTPAPLIASVPPATSVPATAVPVLPTATARSSSAIAGVGEIIATIPLDIAPLGIAVGTDTLWVWSEEAGKVTRIDTLTNEVIATIKIGNPNLAPYGSPKTIVVDGETVWVTDPGGAAVVRIDTATNTVTDRISLSSVKLADGKHIYAPFGLALDGNTLWVSDFNLNSVIRVDIQAKKVVAVIEGVAHPEGIALSPGAVWVIQHRSNSLVQIDPETNKIVGTINLSGSSSGICGMCLDLVVLSADSIWVPLDRGQAVARIDLQTNEVTAQIAFNSDVRGVAIGEGAIWVTGSLWSPECAALPSIMARIDPRTNTIVGQMPVPCAISVAVSNGDVWVGSAVLNTLTRIRPEK